MQRDYGKHRQVATAFYEHARRAVAESEFSVVEVNGDQQRGRTFGARLANALADVFGQGYDRVIVVGSDCPRLHEVDWSAVDAQLADGTPVLGPTSGETGTYLIGLTREHFDRDALAGLPWQTSSLFPALTQHLTEQSDTAPTLLPARDDVNGHRELRALLRDPAALPHPLLVRLRLAMGEADTDTPLETATSARHVVGHRSRAPPTSPHCAR